MLDAARVAREALSREHLAQPRRRGDREAMRVLLSARQGAVVARTRAIGQLKAIIVNAPEQLRQHFRQMSTHDQLARCARLRTLPSHPAEHRATVIALRSVARRALALEADAADLESRLEELVVATAPALLDEPGVGAITAAQLLLSWSHPGQLRSEAAFASLAGAAPASSTGPCTRSCSRAWPTTQRRAPMRPAERVRGGPRGRSGAASSAFVARRLFRLLEASEQAPAISPPKPRLQRLVADSDPPHMRSASAILQGVIERLAGTDPPQEASAAGT